MPDRCKEEYEYRGMLKAIQSDMSLIKTWSNPKSHNLQGYIKTLDVQHSVGVEIQLISNFPNLNESIWKKLTETTAVLFW